MQNEMLYTIGHSTHPIELFISILKNMGINVIFDVRSTPYSKFAEQYNKDRLKTTLEKYNITYVPMGEQLGARYSDRSLLFTDGKVDFNKVEKTEKFKDGIMRINDDIKKGFTIALMCSEKNPLECHRFSMISHYLYNEGYEIIHLLPERTIEHGMLEDKLFEYYLSTGKISLELDKILGINEIQINFLNMETKDDMYLSLNRLIGYDSFSKRESEVW
jgi:uncharacterized protein (DUF488 family)